MFDMMEARMTERQMVRGQVGGLASLLNLMETGRVDGPWAHCGQVVLGPSGLRVVFDGSDAAVICPTFFSERLAPRGARRAQMVFRADVDGVDLEDLALYVKGIDAAIRAERDRMAAEPDPVGDAATSADNATAVALELSSIGATLDGRMLADGTGVPLAGEDGRRLMMLPLRPVVGWYDERGYVVGTCHGPEVAGEQRYPIRSGSSLARAADCEACGAPLTDEALPSLMVA